MSDFVLDVPGGRMRVRAIDASIVRVTFTRTAAFSDKPSFMVLPHSTTPIAFDVLESSESVTLRTSRLQVQIDRQSGAITWLDAAGNLLVAEPASGGKTLEPFQVEKRIFDPNTIVRSESTVDGIKARVAGAKVVVDRSAFSTKLDLVFSSGEAIYGLGQHEEGILNYRGHCQYLYQQNMKVAMPVIVSTRGYGILWDTTSLAVFHDDAHGSYLWTECDDEMDFYFIVGPEFDEIVASLRKLTGNPSMLPRWAYGYIQSKERYRTQQELLDVVAEYRRRRIPIDCIVLDWCSWAGKWWGNKTPDAERFPDPTQLVSDLHAMNTNLMVSIWPIMRGECPDQIQMRQRGFLLGNDATYNAFDSAARELYWRQVHDGWFRHGVDAWWCDCTEPFEADWKGPVKPDPWKRVMINTHESKTFLDPAHITAYSIVHSQGIYEHQRSTRQDKRVVNLTRSGLPGQQRYGAITWSGDIPATWSTVRKQIADGLNFCVTGNPRWTFDIGAFFVDHKEQWFWRGDYPRGCDDPGYRELYVRWLQLGTFLPMMRSHGTDTPREVWRFGQPGDDTYDAIVRFINLRYRLLLYIYSIAAWEHLFDYTMMRMLAFDYRDDANVFDIDDQFMFGPAFMVCPVTEPAAQGSPLRRAVYLPRGCTWHDFWTGAQFDGGQRIVVENIALDRIPLFVRGGSVVPMGPIVQHTSESLKAPIELRIYDGADARFSLYEDDNDGYGYERGACSLTPISWDERAGVLTIAPPQGRFNSMMETREFKVVRVREGRGVDVERSADIDYTIIGSGEARWQR